MYMLQFNCINNLLALIHQNLIDNLYFWQEKYIYSEILIKRISVSFYYFERRYIMNKIIEGENNMELKVDNKIISYMKIDDEDYISITDMLKSKDGNFFVTDWLRNRNTIEFLGIWEELHNPTFNYGEFAIIKSQAGLNSYKLSVKEWRINNSDTILLDNNPNLINN